MADDEKQIFGTDREVEGGGQSSGLPARGASDVGANEPLERSGQRHWKEATVTDESLENRSNVFFAAVEMTRMPMLLSDARTPDEPVVFVNRAFLDLTGYDEDEIIGRNCRFLQGAQTDPETVAELRSAVRERRATSVEILNYKRDGTPFWNAVFMGPVFDNDGEILYFFASQLDVTRRRNTEQNLRQAQKMEAIGQLTAGLAHDFNNLLQVVTGNLERLAANPAPDKAGRYLNNAAMAADRAARLTKQLLAFARKTRLEPRSVDVSELVTGIREMIETTVGGKVALDLDLHRELPRANVDPSQLEIAIINLLINARDASKPGGRVRVSTAPLRRPPEGRGLPSGDYVVLCVEDDGIGMPAHVAERATEPFFSTKSPDEGTGLGLAMVSGFVQQSRGKLEIESELGRGTVVKLILPVHTTATTDIDPAHKPVSVAGPERPGAHILVVEDNPDVLDLAAEWLSTLGYRVTTASNADQAMEVFRRAESPVDLLFSDIIMPGSMNGIMLAEEVRRRSPATRVLLATGYNEELVDGPARPGLDVLGKPYRKTDLADRVRQALREAGSGERNLPPAAPHAQL